MSFNVAGDNPLSHVLPHPLITREADLGFLSQDGVITLLSDQIVMMIIAGLLIMIFVPMAVRRRRGRDEIGQLVPSTSGNAIETICNYFREEVARPQLGEHTDRFIKYIWTVFFFVLTVNILGLLPLGVVTPPLLGVHIGGTATGNIWVTATMAILTLLMMVINGLRLGGTAYLAHFAPGPIWLAPLMVLIEVSGLAAKTAALAIRLFANMIAGHILMAVLVSLILMAGIGLGTAGGLGVGLVVALGSVAITLLELFVAFLQAFIFTYLTTLFIGMSVNLHHDEH